MEACITPLPEVSDLKEVAGGALKKWPERLTAVPPRIASGSIEGVTAEMFVEDTELWKKRVGHYKSMIAQLGQKGRYRNLLDMNAKFGGFAAALVNDPLWVMNMVPTVGNSTTLGIIYERGLIGSYQDWYIFVLQTWLLRVRRLHSSLPDLKSLSEFTAGVRACPRIPGPTTSFMQIQCSHCTMAGKNIQYYCFRIQSGTAEM